MERNQIIAVSGPKQGVGKTTFAINFATQYALNTKKQVVVLDIDRNCLNDVAYYLNSAMFETVENLWKIVGRIKMDNIDPNLFKGRIVFSEQGVGVVSLSQDAKQAKEIKAEQILKILAIFGNLYTFVIDIDNIDEDFLVPIFDMCDYVFWMMLPELVSLNSTVHVFEALQNLNFNMDKFGVVLNKGDLDEGLPVKQINSTIQSYQKNIIDVIPQEKAVMRAVNAKQVLVLDAPHTQFAKIVRELADTFAKREKNIVEDDTKSGNIWKDLVSKITDTASSSEASGEETSAEYSAPQTQEDMRNNIKSRVHKQMIQELNNRKIDLNAGQNDPKKALELRKTVEQTAKKILSAFGNLGFSRQENEDLIREIMDDALGLGPLEELLRDKTITEIMVNRKDQIYVERSGKLVLLDKKFNSDDQVVQVIRRIISPLGRRIDESVPLVDARLKDGSRVNAIIPPLSVQGPMITIRRFPDKPLLAEDMIGFGSVTKDMIDFLRAAVISEKNMIVSGGTGSGKTTLLNMLSSFIPDTERILTVEDVAELRMQQAHVGRLEARPPNIEGTGEVTIRDLVKNTLRMRPDRIVVGECRGGEALDMLQAMNTGHDGSLTTIHANSPHDMIGRLEAMVLMSGSELPVRVIRGYIASAVNLVVQIGRLQDGTRKVLAITEVTGIDEQTNAISMQNIFEFHRTGVNEDGKVLGEFVATGVVPNCYEEFKLRGLDLSIDIFNKK